MKVPTLTTMRTTPTSATQAYSTQQANPDAFGAGLAKAVSQFGALLQVEDKKKEKFDVTREYIRETTDLQQDFRDRQVSAPLGADGFSDTILNDYSTRHQGIIEDMRKRGFSAEALEEMDIKLAGLRDNVLGQSITFQSRSYNTKVMSEFDEVGTSLTQIASMNPYDMEGALETLDEAVDAIPNLSAEQRVDLKMKNASAIRVAAARGLAQQDPETVVAALGGVRGPSSYREAIGAIESRGSGGYNAIGPRHATLGRALGKYQIMEANIGPWSKKYLGAEVTAEEFLASPAIQDALFDGEFNSYVKKYGEEGAAQAWLGGAGSVGKVDRADSNGTTVGNYGQRFMLELAKTGGAVAKDGKTGNVILDSLDATERMAVLNQAQTAINQRQASLKGPLNVTLDNASAAYMNTGEYAGYVPTQTELISAFGPVEGQQKYSQLLGEQASGEFIVGMKTQTEAQIAATLASLRPTDTASPTYATDSKTFEAAQRAADRVIKLRNEDPANYVMTQFPNVAQSMGAMDSPEQREQGYAAMASAYDQLGILRENQVPLTSAAAQQAVSAFNSSSPEGKMGMLSSWRKEMGGLYGQGLSQLAKEGLPVPAYLSGLLQDSPSHANVAANVLRGMDIIEQDKSRKPAFDQVNEIFRTTMGDAQLALNPTVSQSINEAATALYVFRGGDPKDIDTSMLQGALRDVLGGDADNEDTGILDVMGSNSWFGSAGISTILPAGTTGTQFTNWQNGLTSDDLIDLSTSGEAPQYSNGQLATAEDIANEGIFIKVAPNQYIVRMNSDGGSLVKADGDYYKMNITPDEIKMMGDIQVGDITIGETE